jgi:hypothetical protein
LERKSTGRLAITVSKGTSISLISLEWTEAGEAATTGAGATLLTGAGAGAGESAVGACLGVGVGADTCLGAGAGAAACLGAGAGACLDAGTAESTGGRAEAAEAAGWIGAGLVPRPAMRRRKPASFDVTEFAMTGFFPLDLRRPQATPKPFEQNLRQPNDMISDPILSHGWTAADSAVPFRAEPMIYRWNRVCLQQRMFYGLYFGRFAVSD